MNNYVIQFELCAELSSYEKLATKIVHHIMKSIYSGKYISCNCSTVCYFWPLQATGFNFINIFIINSVCILVFGTIMEKVAPSHPDIVSKYQVSFVLQFTVKVYCMYRESGWLSWMISWLSIWWSWVQILADVHLIKNIQQL